MWYLGKRWNFVRETDPRAASATCTSSVFHGKVVTTQTLWIWVISFFSLFHLPRKWDCKRIISCVTGDFQCFTFFYHCMLILNYSYRNKPKHKCLHDSRKALLLGQYFVLCFHSARKRIEPQLLLWTKDLSDRTALHLSADRCKVITVLSSCPCVFGCWVLL